MIERHRLTLLPQGVECEVCGTQVYFALAAYTGRPQLVEASSSASGGLVLRIKILGEDLRLFRGGSLTAGSPVFVSEPFNERLHGDRNRYIDHLKKCRGARRLWRVIFP